MKFWSIYALLQVDKVLVIGEVEGRLNSLVSITSREVIETQFVAYIKYILFGLTLYEHTPTLGH